MRDLRVVRSWNSHTLQLRAPEGAVDQILLTDPRYVPIDNAQPRRLRGAGREPTRATIELTAVLSDVLTLPCANDLDYALAIDWYKQPSNDVQSTNWPNTEIGDLVSRGKYRYFKPEDIEKQATYGRALVERLAPVVRRHPLLRAVDAIAAAPGHDAKVVSFGARLATSVATALGKRLVRCTSLDTFRTSAKELPADVRAAAIRGRFVCGESVARASLLIVDDVYRSGTTAAETARALRAAGATRVASLCAVRTLRF